MKKTRALLLALALCAALAACGSGASSSAPAQSAPADSGTGSQASGTVTLKIGASPAPHAEILGHAAELLKEKGIELEIVQFDDYVIPNTALDEGSLDANYFQHLPYLTNFNAERGLTLVSAGAIHYEPLGVYAGKSNDLLNVPDGAVIGIPDDATNGGRALLLLQEQGVLKLKDGIDLDTFRNAESINFTEYDGIAENPHNVKIEALTAANLPATQPEIDFALINGN